MRLGEYLFLQAGLFRRRTEPRFDQEKGMKFKSWKFRCQYNQWGETGETGELLSKSLRGSIKSPHKSL